MKVFLVNNSKSPSRVNYMFSSFSAVTVSNALETGNMLNSLRDLSAFLLFIIIYFGL